MTARKLLPLRLQIVSGAAIAMFAVGCESKPAGTETPAQPASNEKASAEKPVAPKVEAAPKPVDPPWTDAVNEFSLRAPDEWRTYPSDQLAVPGEVRGAWTPDDHTTIVAFVQRANGVPTARAMLDASAAGMRGIGCDVSEERVATVAGMTSMWLVAEGPGTGSALVPGGAVRTAQHWVAIPREETVIVLLLTTPAAELAEHGPMFREMLDTVEVKGAQLAEQKESE